MLGSFSFGDYFKQGAVEFAHELSTTGFGFDPERIWVTVFGGDQELGIGPDHEAIECWHSVGVHDSRIVLLSRDDNFWQAGPTGPCGPCSELYLEYWNLVFMQLELHPDGSTTPLPKQNIDTGLGLERMAAILQDVPSVFETDELSPLVALGEELSGRRHGDDRATTRALRILADHGRGMTFLLADGVVPSNEDRGYILRRVMRRAIQQGRVLGIERRFLPLLCERVIEVMGEPYPELRSERDTILKWAGAEEESFNRTLAQGQRLLADVIARARAEKTSWVDAEDAFRLHDTYGFPYELTKELLAEDGRYLAKLPESPFYAEGGGQVSDIGVVETPSGRADVAGVYRLGEDQAVAPELADGELGLGDPALAIVDRGTRLATMANHTATHLLHAALRAELGTHVRQAGSYVGPDKLRFDFTHGERLTPDQIAAVEEQVNAWIVESHPVRAVQTTRDEAERLGAMALFGEKYGDIVRMVDIEEVSRELCGGTHVASTAEIGLFHLTNETSSASNVRRVEAVKGPGGVDLFRRRTRELQEIAALLKVPEQEVVVAVEKLQAQLRDAAKRPRQDDRALAESLTAGASEIGGIRVVAEVVEAPDAKALLELSDRVKQSLGDSAVVLGTAVDGRVHLGANFADAAVKRGLKAGDVVRVAAQAAGGGGGGRDTMAQAGGPDPERLPDAIT